MTIYRLFVPKTDSYRKRPTSFSSLKPFDACYRMVQARRCIWSRGEANGDACEYSLIKSVFI